MIVARWGGLPIERIEYSYLGLNSLSGASAPLPPDPTEVVVRVVFTAAEADVLRTAARRLMALGLSGPAGMGVLGASVAAEPRAVIGLWPALINRDAVTYQVHLLEVTP